MFGMQDFVESILLVAEACGCTLELLIQCAGDLLRCGCTLLANLDEGCANSGIDLRAKARDARCDHSRNLLAE